MLPLCVRVQLIVSENVRSTVSISLTMRAELLCRMQLLVSENVRSTVSISLNMQAELLCRGSLSSVRRL